MPTGEGYWLHPNKKPVEVFEHLSDVLQDPRKYGLTASVLTREPGEQDDVHRRRVLVEVLKKGWIRARSHKGYTVFEYWRFTHRTADAIWSFITETLWAGPGASFNLHELSTGQGFSVRLSTFYDDIEPHLRGAQAPKINGGQKLYRLACAMGQGRCARP